MIETYHNFRQFAPHTINSATLKLQEPPCITLSNGVEIFSFVDKIQQALRIDMVFNAGSAYQNKVLVAGSALKMMREGSKKYRAGAIHAKIDYHGAYLDLQTTKDNGFLSLYCLDKSLPSLLPLLENIIKEPDYKEKSFKVFNKRQKQDFLVSSKKNKHLANRLFTAQLYGAHSKYGQVAQEEDFDGLKITDLMEFHHRHLEPSTMKIVLSGPVTDKMIHAVALAFGGMWNSSPRPDDFLQETQFAPQYLFQHQEQSLQSAILMGRPIMARSHPDYFGFLVLNTILGGYFGSRLMKNIREDKGYTYGISSAISTQRKATGFMIRTEVGSEVTRQALKEIQSELNLLCNEKVSDDELTLVKNYLTGTYTRSLDGVYHQAEKFLITLENKLGMKYFEDSLAAFNSITSEELLLLAQKYLSPESMLTVIVGKEA